MLSPTFEPAARLVRFAGDDDNTRPFFVDDLRDVVLPSAQWAFGSALRAAASVRPASAETMHACAATVGADSASVDPPGPEAPSLGQS